MVEKESPLVSIIVPVYTSERYIAKCIDSILNQSYRKFELILVDDGSPDRSGEICDDYAQKDDRIKVIHTPNGGVSHARNTGISHAKGKYLFFVDSDDWVEPGFLQHMLPQGEEDLVYVGYTREFPDGRTEAVEKAEKMLTFDKENRDFIERVQMAFVFCGCFRADICRSHSVAFDENIAVGEDIRFILQYLEHCNCIRFAARTDYHYFQNPGSVIHRYHCNKLEQQMADCMQLEQFTGKEDMQRRWRSWRTVQAHYLKWMRSGQSAKQVKREAKRKLKETYKNTYFRSCIPSVRQNGSLDQKIESYFMRYALHPFYAPCYHAVMVLAKIKRLLVRSQSR